MKDKRKALTKKQKAEIKDVIDSLFVDDAEFEPYERKRIAHSSDSVAGSLSGLGGLAGGPRSAAASAILQQQAMAQLAAAQSAQYSNMVAAQQQQMANSQQAMNQGLLGAIGGAAFGGILNHGS